MHSDRGFLTSLDQTDRLALVKRQFMGPAVELLPLMLDSAVTDILINGCLSLYVERDGVLVSGINPFSQRESLTDFIERLLIPIGKRIDASQPYTDGRLLEGSRFHIILPPIALGGPLVSIRKLRDWDPSTLWSFGPERVIRWLKAQVVDRKNILIVGGTGTGKTTLLSLLLSEVPEGERVAIIEESMEISTPHPHVIHLEARSPSPEGRGEVTLRTLIRNALRMRPDRIVVGECRGEEAFDMLQAMNTGHPGSLSTVHGNSALEALRRLESLLFLTGYAMPLKSIREWISLTIQTVLFLKKLGGARKIAEIIQLHGLEGDVYRFQPVYRKEE